MSEIDKNQHLKESVPTPDIRQQRPFVNTLALAYGYWDGLGFPQVYGTLLGLLQNQDSWLVKSNAETGEGYSDISIQTPDRVGMVIERKYADDGNLEAACREALKQIKVKKYAEGLKYRGIKTIIKYGIAFCGKVCMVMMA